MGKISLRTYDREIEALIEQGQRIDEAIAHCAHILEAYPRHLETQRLLAKAYVEAKRHEQAVDSFERVLASVPEDFVSHVGLSVIAADNGRLDDAILHMERAFEAQPSNAVIQGELQRLYGRRDGVEPPKVRLTRGALAHVYMQGELYSQAISEAKGVLSSDSERTDMQSLLARAYFRNGQDTEATQVCTELLGRYPYCLEANRLMAAMLVRSGREDLGEQFRQRLNELDPYAAFASESLLHTADVADSAITLDRLKYSAAEVDDGAVERLDAQPESTAVSFDAHAPGWLSDGAPKEASTTRGSRPTDDIPPFLRRPSRPDEALESEETREARTQNIQSTAGWVPDKLPPWMRKLAFTEQSAEAAKGPAATSDPPVWLRQLDSGQSPAGDRIRVHSTNATAGSDHDVQSRMHNAEAARLDRASGQRDAEDAAIPGFPSSGLQEDDALALLNTLSEKDRGQSDPLLDDWKGLESSDIVSDQERTPSNTDASGMQSNDFGTTGNGDEASVLSGSSAAGDEAFEWGNGVGAAGDPGGTEAEGENTWTPIIEELDAPDWLVDGHPIPQGPAANEGEPVWSGHDSTETSESVSEELRESPLEFESVVDYPNMNEGLDADETVSPPEIRFQDAAPPWLQPRAEPEPRSTERTRPADWRRLERDEWSGADDSGADKAFEGLINSQPPPSESNMGDGGISQPANLPAAGSSVPLEPRPNVIEPSPGGDTVVSLGDAQSALGRGNIAAALDIYAKLIRKGRSLEEIIRDLRDALYRYPVEVPIWQALGDAYMRANRLQEALDAYTKAEELLR